MLVFVGANFVATIFLTWTPKFLVEKFHFKLGAAGLSGSVFIHLASAFSAPLGGFLADRLRQRIAGGRVLVQAIGLLLGSVAVFFVGMTGDVRTLMLAMTLFGFCKGLYDSNIFAALYDVVEPRGEGHRGGSHERGRVGRRGPWPAVRGLGLDAWEVCHGSREHERGHRVVRRGLPVGSDLAAGRHLRLHPVGHSQVIGNGSLSASAMAR